MKTPNRRSGFLLTLLLMALAGCTPPGNSESEPASDRLPPWLDKLTQQIRKDRLTQPPSQILTFRYRDQTVFYRPPYCCDVPGVIYNAKGSVMCYPTGGYTGKGDRQCQDFLRTRSKCAEVWRDPRAKPSTDNACAIERGNRPLR